VLGWVDTQATRNKTSILHTSNWSTSIVSEARIQNVVIINVHVQNLSAISHTSKWYSKHCECCENPKCCNYQCTCTKFECKISLDLQLIWQLTCSNSKLNLFKSIMPRNSHLEISFIAKPPFQHIYPYAFSTWNLWKIDILALKRAWVASYDETIDPNNLAKPNHHIVTPLWLFDICQCDLWYNPCFKTWNKH